MIDQIEKHFAEEYPREGCGIIGVTKGKKEWFPCKNLAEDDKDFVLCPQDYFKVKQKTDIIGIVHSHVEQSNEPSPWDISNCNALGIPYYIFSYPSMDLNIVQPKKNFNPLVGREYKFGIADCYEAARDYYASIGIEIVPREVYKQHWYESNLDYMTEEAVIQKGFKKVESPEKHDLILFSIKSNVNNHIGVFLGNDIFFHHAENRLSCKESLYPFWARHVTGFYRYEA
jgi:proteasome lid subunit RPN8/RPN11